MRTLLLGALLAGLCSVTHAATVDVFIEGTRSSSGSFDTNRRNDLDGSLTDELLRSGLGGDIGSVNFFGDEAANADAPGGPDELGTVNLERSVLLLGRIGGVEDVYSFSLSEGVGRVDIALFEQDRRDGRIASFDIAEDGESAVLLDSTLSSGSTFTGLLLAILEPGIFTLTIDGSFGGSGNSNYDIAIAASPVPLPGAAALFGTVLVGAGLVRRARARAALGI